MTTLTYISVNGLLGRFHHTVQFPASDSFVILHGPNGVGKTHLLQMVQAMLSGDFWRLGRIRFDSATLGFSDGSKLDVRKFESQQEQLDLKVKVRNRDFARPRKNNIEVVLQKPGWTPVTWRSDRVNSNVQKRGSVRRLIETELGLENIGSDEWFDPRIGQFLSMEDVLARYAAKRPERYRDIVAVVYQIDTAILEFLFDTPVNFVRTQRLLIADELVQSSVDRPGTRSPRESTVVEFSEDLTRIIARTLADNSKISSRLDRTFPMRVLTRRDETTINTNELVKKHQEQTEFRNQLAEVSLAEESLGEYPAELPLSGLDLDATERRVLKTYLEDAEQKLGAFRDTLSKITLLRRIVNDRFLYKKLNIDGSDGFVFVTDEGEIIGPDQLSSGEQHELVLLYELLFRTKPGSVVLIDEPEISLHVSWQRKFIRDLQSVSALSNLRFIIATHSPQIVDRWHSKAVFLAPGDDWA